LWYGQDVPDAVWRHHADARPGPSPFAPNSTSRAEIRPRFVLSRPFDEHDLLIIRIDMAVTVNVRPGNSMAYLRLPQTINAKERSTMRALTVC
jgi:hypothetical protein